MKRIEFEALLVVVGYGLAAFFAAWASYRIHVLPMEQAVLPILEALISLEGRAPDQYRLLPYLLISGLNAVLGLFSGELPELRVAVLLFDSLFLWLSALLLLHTFKESITSHFVWIIFLIYPFLMFDGYRPISSFILFLSISTVALMRTANSEQRMETVENPISVSFV